MFAVISDPMLRFSRSGESIRFVSGEKVLAEASVGEVQFITFTDGLGMDKHAVRIVLTMKNWSQLIVSFPEGCEGDLMYQHMRYSGFIDEVRRDFEDGFSVEKARTALFGSMTRESIKRSL